MKTPQRDGATYESTYLKWIEFFRGLALADKPEEVVVPRSWVPLCKYMGHFPVKELRWFPEDDFLAADLAGTRRMVEVSSTCRPEVVHALYIWDIEWSFKSKLVLHTDTREEFPVTCNGSFFRPEVMKYLGKLHSWAGCDELSGTVILCPCAADKPYPAPLHKKIREAVPQAYMIVVTGVLGLIPEHFWVDCPVYDSGLPNFVRVYEEVGKFVTTHSTRLKKARVVIYSDHYAYWIVRGWYTVSMPPPFSVFPECSLRQFNDYKDLMAEENLRKLAAVCRL